MSAPRVAPQRCHALCARSPSGRGTARVESLSGFLVRLSAAHGLLVTDVLDHLVREFIEPRGLLVRREAIPNFLRNRAGLFDGVGEFADALARALGLLGPFPDLSLHTFSAWGVLLRESRPEVIVQGRKRWCAACFEEWKREGVEPWEPLLWRLTLVEYCPVHRERLLDACPSCGAVQPIVSQRILLGFCVRCAAPLHGARARAPRLDLERECDPQTLWAWWRSVALARMVAAQGSDALRARPGGFARLLDRAAALAKHEEGLSECLFAHRLDFAQQPFQRFRRGDELPRLPMFIDACLQLGADPLVVATGREEQFAGSWPVHDACLQIGGGELLECALRARESRSQRTYPSLSRDIDAALGASPPVPIAEVARAHKVGVFMLCRRFPLRSARVHARYLCRRKDARADVIEQIASGLEALRRERGARSVNTLAKALGVTWTEIARGFPDEARELVELRRQYLQRTKGQLRERCAVALREAFLRERCPAITEVSRCVGVRRYVLLRWFPKECQALVARRKAERGALLEHCRETLERERLAEQPRSLEDIAKGVGVSRPTLNQYWPKLCAEILARRPPGTGPRSRRGACPKTIARCEVALCAESRKARPRTVSEMAKLLGFNNSGFLVRWCKPQYEALCRARERVLVERMHALRAALRAESDSPAPRAPAIVCAEFKVDPKSARLHCAEEYHRLKELRRGHIDELYANALVSLRNQAASEDPESLRAVAISYRVNEETLKRLDAGAARTVVAARVRARMRWRAEREDRVRF